MFFKLYLLFPFARLYCSRSIACLGDHDPDRTNLHIHQTQYPLFLPPTVPRSPQLAKYRVVGKCRLRDSLAHWINRVLPLPVLARPVVLYAVLPEIQQATAVPYSWPVQRDINNPCRYSSYIWSILRCHGLDPAFGKHFSVACVEKVKDRPSSSLFRWNHVSKHPLFSEVGGRKDN